MPFGPIAPSDGTSATGTGGAAAASPSGGFAGMLANAVSGLNDQMVSSEHLSEQAALGQVSDPTTALVAVEKADLAFQTAVQIRNKLLDGWQEISRMQV